MRRDAWAFAQRICGVCTTVHAIASIRAVENAIGAVPPPNARVLRTLIIAAQCVQDHVVHFYHLHALDWVDVVSALSADPAATAELAQSISDWHNSSTTYFKGVKERLKGFVDRGQLGPFANAYWGHPAYKLPPEVNLLAVSHYLDALTWQREVAQLHTIFGGKNPHPHFIVGGAPNPIDLDSDSAINGRRLTQIQTILRRMREFVDQAYVPDTLAIASFYKEWGLQGEGLGNFMCYGDLPARGMNHPEEFLFPRGAILGRDLSHVEEVDLEDPEQIEEYVARSYYEYSVGKGRGLHPYDGETNLHYTGPKPPYTQLEVEQNYSWLKAPRWKGKAMEVGPLARMLLLYVKGNEQAKALVDSTLQKLELPVEALFSTLGRVSARTLETKLLADSMQGWYDQLIANIRKGETRTFNEKMWDPSTWPRQARGAGYMEAPRGALAHWIVIEDGKISNYQAVVPSTWNAGPRDAAGQPGAYEAALVGHALHDPKQPIEILRTIHSFDPCLACAVHVLDENRTELIRVKVQ